MWHAPGTGDIRYDIYRIDAEVGDSTDGHLEVFNTVRPVNRDDIDLKCDLTDFGYVSPNNTVLDEVVDEFMLRFHFGNWADTIRIFWRWNWTEARTAFSISVKDQGLTNENQDVCFFVCENTSLT